MKATYEMVNQRIYHTIGRQFTGTRTQLAQLCGVNFRRLNRALNDLLNRNAIRISGFYDNGVVDIERVNPFAPLGLFGSVSSYKVTDTSAVELKIEAVETSPTFEIVRGQRKFTVNRTLLHQLAEVEKDIVSGDSEIPFY